MKRADNSGERLLPGEISSEYERLMYLRHLFAYEFAASLIGKQDHVLEIGFGDGYGAVVLAAAAARVAAIDNSDEAAAAAAGKYQAGNLSFSSYPGGKLPFPDKTFDAVAAFQVIEHLRDDEFFVAELRRVLKDGGLCVLTTPNRDYRLKPGQRPWFRHHVREYGREELAALLPRHFRETEVRFVRSPEKLCAMERRVASMATLAQKIDPLGLRELFPPALKKAVFSLLGGKDRPNAGGGDWSTGDFSDSHEAERGLDLLAVCRK